MTDAERVALTRVWWTWRTPCVEHAIDSAVHRRWLAVARSRPPAGILSCASPAKRCSRTLLPGLRALFHVSRYSEGQLDRLRSGGNAPSSRFLLGLATALKLADVRAFFPETTLRWVAEAAQYLCTQGDPPGPPSVGLPEAEAYAGFLLRDPPRDSAHSAGEIERRLMALPADARAAVQKVARRLGPVLAVIDPDGR
jgi:hypothetical protein